MKKLKMHTPDFTDENIKKLAELFPNCVTESRDDDGKLKKAIDFDQLRQELSTSVIDGPRERYQLNWPGKREALLAANAPIAKTLRPCREESVDFDTTQNLFIEGDNLDALKLLQETYLNKVKMIYIDPPYNTGNDFVYDDDFTEDTEAYFQRSNQKDEVGNRMVANTEANGRFHSDWMTMMYPRLKLAKNLLREDGVIFISIDDGEVANIRKICDEIFGENGFVGVFSWRSRTAKADVPYGVSNDVEWIVTYAKPMFIAGRFGERNYYKSDDYDDRWRLQDITTNKTKSERPNSFFTMINPRNGDEYSANETRTWSVTEDTFPDYYKKGKIVFPGDYSFLNIKRPAFRVFEKEDKQKALQKYGTEDVKMSISTFLPEEDVGRTQHGSKEIRKLFGSQVFSYPKPTGLIRYFIENISDDDAIIVDFFAGSGTTADAVLQQNQKDKGKRKFILIQLPEPLDPAKTEQKTAADYCMSLRVPLLISELTKERIRRAGKKIKDESGSMKGEKKYEVRSMNYEGTATDENIHPSSLILHNLDIGFRVLKVDSSNMKDVYYSPDAVTQDDLFSHANNIREDRTSEDLLFQVLLDWGVDLSLPITQETIGRKTVFFVDENALAACFESDISEEMVKELAARKPLRVVFRDSGFVSDSVKINVEQIFKLISPGTDVKTI